jgi:hypothetical protein
MLGVKPKLHPKTLIVVARIINGDDAIWTNCPVSPWRNDEAIAEFLVSLGIQTSPLANATSREARTAAWLAVTNGTESLAQAVEESVNPHHFAHTDFKVGPAVDLLNQSLRVDGYELIPAGRSHTLAKLRAHLNVVQPPHPLSDGYVQEMVAKCDVRLAAEDSDGAITVARTLIESVLGELEIRLLGSVTDFAGDLQRQYKHVMKAMRLDESEGALDDALKQTLRGLVSTINGLSTLRNRLSDGHARARQPMLREARLAVNAAKTVAVFLVETYIQASKDLSRPAS